MSLKGFMAGEVAASWSVTKGEIQRKEKLEMSAGGRHYNLGLPGSCLFPYLERKEKDIHSPNNRKPENPHRQKLSV